MELFKYTLEELYAILDTVGIQKKETQFETMFLDNLNLEILAPKIKALDDREKYVVLAAILDSNVDETFRKHFDFLSFFKEEILHIKEIS